MVRKTEAAPTLKDVAEAVGVSVAAVSKVLNNREGVSAINRARVTRIAEEIGYRGRGKKAAAGTRVSSATVVTLDRYVTNDVFYGEIIDNLLEFARSEGLGVDVAIVTSTDPETGEYDAIRSTEPRATILVGIDDPRVIEAVRATGRPAVLVNGMDRKMQISSVSPDYNFGGWAATRHLLDLGHRDILHVTHVYRESLRRRMLGFRDAIEEAGIAFSPARHILDVGHPQMISISCRDLVGAYLGRCETRPTALFCVSDMLALGAIQAITAMGLSVPGDISVIGFDGLSLGAHSTPPLTSMQMDRQLMARLAVQLLLDQSEGEFRTARRLALGVRLVERDSTAPGPYYRTGEGGG